MKNELRIGNLVWDFNVIHPTEKFVSVETIEEEGCLLRNERGVYRIKYCYIKPIPLTEEWLVKLGFKIIENNWKCLNLHFATISWERLAGLALSFEKESIYLPHIKHVHQLQNLYFALTGQELTIKHN